MLREYWLNRIALACGLAGAIILLYFSLVIEPVEVRVSEIDSGMESQRVTVQGRIDWQTEKNRTLIFTLDDGDKIKAVKFNSSEEEKGKICTGCFVKLTGIVEIYRGELEIVAEEIERID